MDSFTPMYEVSLAPLILIIAGVSAGIAAMTGRRRLAIALGVVAAAALAGMVVWTMVP